MRRLARLIALGALAALVVPSVAQAGHTTDPRTKNMHPLGHIFEPAVTGGFGGASPDIHTDIAFWGKRAIQGNWNGFNIRDISDPENPTQVSRTECPGNQGDVLVWGNIIVRSWNTPAGTPGVFGAGTTCDGVPVPPGAVPGVGFEGLHVFDASNEANPQLVAQVPLACGSHTATAVPDLANNRLLVYSSPSAHSNSNPNPPATCDWFDIVAIPLSNPGGASFLRAEPAMHTCHDVGVILGDVMRAACAGGTGFRVFDLSDSLVDPELMHHVDVPTVTVGHSAAFSWDGDTIVFGWEPGGGLEPECTAQDPPEKKSFFFYDTETGAFQGRWTLPRDQTNMENCTLHNYNVVPLRNGRDVLVSGNYQAGVWVVDFTDRANAKTVGWSDPPAAPVPPGSPFCASNGPAGPRCALTGSWSAHWYDGFIYESNIGEGLNVFKLSGNTLARRIKLGHLNPQTQEFSLPN
jgi:hypothetical protein